MSQTKGAFLPLDTKPDYYSDWIVRMQLKLESKLCFYAVEHDQPETEDPEVLADYTAQNNTARSQIVKYLGPYALNIVKPHIHSAKAMWDALKLAYENRSASNQANLLVKLLTTKMSENKNIENHFAQMDRIIGDLISAGVEGINDDALVAVILLSMPESFRPATTALKMLAINDLNPTHIKSKLTDFKMSQDATTVQIPQNSNAQVNWTAEKQSKNKKKTSSNPQTKFDHPKGSKSTNRARGRQQRGSIGKTKVQSCTYCKRGGHSYDSCWVLMADKKNGRFISSRTRGTRGNFRNTPYQNSSVQPVQQYTPTTAPHADLTYVQPKALLVTDEFGFIGMFLSLIHI